MSDAYRDALFAELDAILFPAVRREGSFKKIRVLYPRLRELIAELHVIDSAVEKAECDYLQRRVQSKKGEHGERLFRYTEQTGFTFPGEEPEERREPRPVYLPLDEILATVDIRREILERDRKHLSGYVRGMGEMDQGERDALQEYIDTYLLRYIATVAQLALPFDVELEDVQKSALDKTGEEAATEPWHATGS